MEYACGDVHAAQAWTTVPLRVSWHSKVAESSSAASVKPAVAPRTPTDVTVTTGAVVSGAATVQLLLATVETFPAPSVPRAENT